MSTMKLYVWEDPYEVEWGRSLLIVMAPNLRAAKKAAAINAPILIENLGKPTRILTGDAAEWHRWEE